MRPRRSSRRRCSFAALASGSSACAPGDNDLELCDDEDRSEWLVLLLLPVEETETADEKLLRWLDWVAARCR